MTRCTEGAAAVSSSLASGASVEAIAKKTQGFRPSGAYLGRIVTRCLLTTILLSSSARASAAEDLQVIDFQLRWHHQFQFAGYYAAITKGFYRAEGLDVRLHEADVGKTPLDEVLAGRAQYGESNSEILYARLHGKPVVALAAIFQHSPSVLLARRDAGVHSVHDLVGKSVMLLNGQTDADFHAMFLHQGIRPEEIGIIPSSYDIEDLISGKVAAFNSYLTNEPFVLKQRGIDYTVINPSAHGIDFYSDILFTTEDELKHHPDRVAAFRRASLKGWRYAMDHPDEIIDVLIERYRVPKSRAHLKFEADTMRTLIMPELIEIGHMNRERWQRMADAFIEVGMGRRDFSLDGFIYHDDEQPLPWWLMPLLLVASLIVALVLGFLHYVHRMNVRLLESDKELRTLNRLLSEEVEVRKQTEALLQQSEQRWQFALEGAGDGVWDTNIQTHESHYSRRYLEILGYAEGEFTMNHDAWESRIHPDDKAQVAADQQAYLQGHTAAYDSEHRLRCKDGEYKWIHARGKVVSHDEDGQPLRIVGTMSDISERKRLESMMQFRQFSLDHAGELVFWLDDTGRFLDVNVTACRELGYSRDEMLRMRLPDIDPVFPFESWSLHWRTLRRMGRIRLESYCKRRDGSLFPTDVIANYFEYQGVAYNCAFVRNITERRQLLDELERKAHQDHLTGLKNRGYFMQLAEAEIVRAMRYGKALSVLMLDIDHFKQINDTHGHKVGDGVLQTFARVCVDTLREVDICGRIGGEEFAVLLPETDREQAFEVAERLRMAVCGAQVFNDSGVDFRFSVSIGIASLNPQAKTLDALLDLADKALYAAKQAGRNAVRHVMELAI